MIATDVADRPRRAYGWLAYRPSHWEVRPLKALATCLDGQRVPVAAALREPGPYPYWGANGIQDWVHKFLFDEPLVLLGEDGAPFFESTKDVAFAVSGPIWVNNHAHVLRPRANVDVRFLAYALNSVDYAEYISGSTRDKLTQHDMNRIALPVPPPLTQGAIADYLHRETNRIDALIEKKQRLVELLDVRRRIVIEHAIRLNTDESVPLRRLVHEVDQRSPDGLGTLLSVSVHLGVVPRNEMTDREGRADDTVGYKQCRRGDLILNRMRAFQGAVGVAGEDGLVSPDYAVLRALSASVHSPYLHYLFRTPWFVGKLSSIVRGIGSTDLGATRTPRVNVRDLLRLMVPDVSREQQRERADKADRIVAKDGAYQSRVERSIQLLLERRHALIIAAVTGQLDIPEAA